MLTGYDTMKYVSTTTLSATEALIQIDTVYHSKLEQLSLTMHSLMRSHWKASWQIVNLATNSEVQKFNINMTFLKYMM